LGIKKSFRSLAGILHSSPTQSVASPLLLVGLDAAAIRMEMETLHADLRRLQAVCEGMEVKIKTGS
jgi:hypothetical protein